MRIHRALTIILVGFICCITTFAQAEYTSDVNHKGYYKGQYGITVIGWKKVNTDCVPCRSLAAHYNWVMHDLMEVRYEQQKAKEDQKKIEESVKKKGQAIKNFKPKKSDSVNWSETTLIGVIIETAKLYSEIDKKLKSREKILAARAQKLRQLIADCEKKCAADGVKTTQISLGGKPAITAADGVKLPDKTSYDLPVKWNGPYPLICPNLCKKITEQLNELPDDIRELQLWLEEAKVDLEIAKKEARIEELTFRLVYYSDDYDPVGKTKKRLKDTQNSLDKYVDLYNRTLAAYKDCITKCGPKKTACLPPVSPSTAISIGINADVGTSAEILGDAKNKVLGSLLGGGATFGSSSGGGGLFGSPAGGGSGSEEPETVDDTTIGEFVSAKSGEVDYGLRANVDPSGKLTVSLELKDVPDDGTFHAQWLEDGNGNIHLPKEYLIYSLYREWTLSVWWTYDRWEDGKHVEHREGDWATAGRDNMGDFKVLYEGKKGSQNAIWNRLGFGTAVKGVNHLGTVYQLPPKVLESDCPVRLVTHVSLPGVDPVVTQPLLSDIPALGHLFKSETGKEPPTTIIMLTPRIVEDN
jgi:hypothetical protein